MVFEKILDFVVIQILVRVLGIIIIPFMIAGLAVGTVEAIFNLAKKLKTSIF